MPRWWTASARSITTSCRWRASTSPSTTRGAGPTKLHREELTKISHKIRESGFTIVPLQLYFVDGRAKVEIGVARGKKEYDKRQTLREQQDKREAQRVMRERNRR